MLDPTEKGPAISVSTITTTVNHKASSAVTVEVKLELGIFDFDLLPTKMVHAAGSKSVSASLALPAKFLGGTEAYPVDYRYKNEKWSFEGLKVDGKRQIRRQGRDVKSLMQKGSMRKTSLLPIYNSKWSLVYAFLLSDAIECARLSAHFPPARLRVARPKQINGAL